ncbi:MAG TPA: hypothetical protein PLI09_21180 [Candidatus Hydrogenedentes bacterium]|nr:hypothetical protein [Candidatus Hydrogenedentota bacterium]
MRARNIKPGVFNNEVLADAPIEARYLFIGLWCLADREGRLEYRPRRIAAAIFPYDREVDAEGLIETLAQLKDADCHPAFIVRYEAEGKHYLQILNFKKHQRIHSNEAESTIPAPPIDSETCHQGDKDLSPRCKALASECLNEECLKDGTTPSGTSPLDDPLADLPQLETFYPSLWAMITDAHPSTRQPEAGSKADNDARCTLARLVHRDKFTEGEIVQALTWLFDADHKDAEFWRGQVGAIEPLRKRGRSGLMKMAAIHECWKKATGAENESDWTDEKAAQFERELAREGGA